MNVRYEDIHPDEELDELDDDEDELDLELDFLMLSLWLETFDLSSDSDLALSFCFRQGENSS